jgi:hypothetical protein
MEEAPIDPRDTAGTQPGVLHLYVGDLIAGAEIDDLEAISAGVEEGQVRREPPTVFA